MAVEFPLLLEGLQLLDAVAAASFPRLGTSRDGREITGILFPARDCQSQPHPQADDESSRQHASAASSSSPSSLLFFGGIHGDEPATVAALLELTQRLALPSPGAVHGDIWVIPALNPDSLITGRKNASSDVDLNRNFPARNFTRTHAPGYDPGPSPLSEPESALLARFLDAHRVGAVVAVHAPFGCVNFDGPAQPWAASVSAACGWPVRENIGYPTPGSFGSWFGGDRGLPVLTLELPPGPLDGFRPLAAAALDAAWQTAPRSDRP